MSVLIQIKAEKSFFKIDSNVFLDEKKPPFNIFSRSKPLHMKISPYFVIKKKIMGPCEYPIFTTLGVVRDGRRGAGDLLGGVGHPGGQGAVEAVHGGAVPWVERAGAAGGVPLGLPRQAGPAAGCAAVAAGGPVAAEGAGPRHLAAQAQVPRLENRHQDRLRIQPADVRPHIAGPAGGGGQRRRRYFQARPVRAHSRHP